MGETLQLRELAQSLEQATQMAKRLFITADPAHLHRIHSSLHDAHHCLSSFLSLPSLLPPSPPPPKPVQMGGEGEDETEVTSNDPTGKVEERAMNWYIQNKRRKRPLSPSSVKQTRMYAAEVARFGTMESKLNALDLVYQFHA